MTHTKRTSAQGSRVVDLTDDSSLVDENAPFDTSGEDVPRSPVTGKPMSEELGFSASEPAPIPVGPVGEDGIGARLGAFMRDRPWLTLGSLALIGFLTRRILPRPDGEVALQPGTLIEIPPGSRLRAVGRVR